MTEEIKGSGPLSREEVKKAQPETKELKTEFKICEIWIKDGRLMLDAPPEFWMDKIRARGILKYCDDIVRDSKTQEEKANIIKPKGSMMNFARNVFKRKR